MPVGVCRYSDRMARVTTLAVTLNAAPSRVYRALTSADDVQRWMVPDGMTSEVHRFEAREGGEFRISLTYESAANVGKTSAHTDTYHGWFVTLQPYELVVQEMEFESDDPTMLGTMTTTLALSEQSGTTHLMVVHDDVPPGVSLADNETGWRMSLAKLARLVEADGTRT